MNTGIGSGTDSANIQGKNEQYMKSQAFANDLNKLIEDGKTIDQDATDDSETEEDEREVTIDTTGYAKWVYNPGDYPILDLTTKWNNTTKKWEKQ